MSTPFSSTSFSTRAISPVIAAVNMLAFEVRYLHGHAVGFLLLRMSKPTTQSGHDTADACCVCTHNRNHQCLHPINLATLNQLHEHAGWISSHALTLTTHHSGRAQCADPNGAVLLFLFCFFEILAHPPRGGCFLLLFFLYFFIKTHYKILRWRPRMRAFVRNSIEYLN